MTRRGSILAALSLGGLISMACFGVGPLDPAELEVTITPPDFVLTAIGAQRRVEFSLGDGLTPSNLVWRSSAPNVATVDSDGMVTAVGDGTATITAQAEGASASTTVTVAATILNVVRVRAQQADPNMANNVSSVSVTVVAN